MNALQFKERVLGMTRPKYNEAGHFQDCVPDCDQDSVDQSLTTGMT